VVQSTISHSGSWQTIATRYNLVVHTAYNYAYTHPKSSDKSTRLSQTGKCPAYENAFVSGYTSCTCMLCTSGVKTLPACIRPGAWLSVLPGCAEGLLASVMPGTCFAVFLGWAQTILACLGPGTWLAASLGWEAAHSDLDYY
jgi:hypothetical protein